MDENHMPITPGSTAEPVYRIVDPPDGCVTCGCEYAIEGHEDIRSPEETPPVCYWCGEVLSNQVVTPLEEETK